MGTRSTKLISSTPRRSSTTPTAFTLIELLVVLAIIALLTAIALPTFAKARQQVKDLLNKSNFKQIYLAVKTYTDDNNDNLMPTAGYTRRSSGTSGNNPAKLIGVDDTVKAGFRAVSQFLYPCLPDADTIYSTEAPDKFKYLQEMWDAGNKWNHPTMGSPYLLDTFRGTYSFYWNYTGYLPQSRKRFVGPTKSTGLHGESKLLSTDYFVRNNLSCVISFSNMDKQREIPPIFAGGRYFKNADAIDHGFREASLWLTDKPSPAMWNTRLNALSIDGSVTSYTPARARIMNVLLNPDTRSNATFPDYTHGDFFIPTQP